MVDDRIRCTECGVQKEKSEICVIDDKPICVTCIYGDSEPLKIYPIGRVRTHLLASEKTGLPPDTRDISCIDLLPSQKRFMYNLDEESSLLIVYHFHLSDSVKSIFNRRLDGKKVGVFASRTPRRLSRIAVQQVRLLRISGMTLYVQGLDAMESSPVLDIKLGGRGHGPLSP